VIVKISIISEDMLTSETLLMPSRNLWLIWSQFQSSSSLRWVFFPVIKYSLLFRSSITCIWPSKISRLSYQ